jgi:lipopolysaccharide biosynthesis glycosyltransferase
MKPTVFIHTNDKQLLGAVISRYSLKKNSLHADKFNVKLIQLKDFPFLLQYEGKPYLRSGKEAIWRKDDLQSFTLLRFAIPTIMNFTGRALVIDPDVFALGDVYELLSRDMHDKSIICREHSRANGNFRGFASSVMLLDCDKIKHWNWESLIKNLFEKKLDYTRLMQLLNEDITTIGVLEESWNDYDTFSADTKMIHFTNRITQPWKTGLKIDFETYSKNKPGLKSRIKKIITSGRYLTHPDPKQEMLFFSLARKALADGALTDEFIKT